MSGQMWNHIRSPPFVMTNPRSHQTSFIHGSTQFQLIAETYIVFGLYAAVSAGVVLLNESTLPKGGDQTKRKCEFFARKSVAVVVDLEFR